MLARVKVRLLVEFLHAFQRCHNKQITNSLTFSYLKVKDGFCTFEF